MAAALMSESPDPWGTCLLVGYKNVSGKEITAVRFSVIFVNAFKEDSPALEVESTQTIRPGKTQSILWRDGVYWNDLGRDRMDARVSVSKVLYRDGSSWSNPEVKAAIDKTSVQATVAGLEGLYPTVHLTFEGSTAVVTAANANETMCKILHSLRVSLQMMHLDSVKVKSDAGEICFFSVSD
jgi:hypothetical protein